MKTSTELPPQGQAAPEQITPSSAGALAALCLSMLLSSLGTSIANVALPTFATVFNASFQLVQWVVLSYLLVITVSIVSLGRLGDVFGRRFMLLMGLGVFIAGSALCALSPALWFLFAARAIQGLGAAVMMALTLAMVSETVPRHKTGSAMGLLGTMSAIGTALGPSLGGVLIAAFGWQAIFFLNVPLGLLALAMGYRYLPAAGHGVRTKRPGFDVPGTLALAITLPAYALAMTINKGHLGKTNAILLGIAGLGLLGFLLVEARVKSPLIQLKMFRNRALSAGLAMTGLVTIVLMTTMVVGPFYLAGGLGLDTAHVGIVMSVGPVVAALSGVPAGRFVDGLGAFRVMAAGRVALAAGSLMLTLMPLSAGVSGYIASIAVLTAGYGAFQAANNTTIMSGIDPDHRGVISGMLNLSRNLGLITGASLMGAVFARAAAAQDITRAAPALLASGMHLTFAVSTGMIMAAIALAMLMCTKVNG